MKGKGSASLYEVLKAATAGPAPFPGGAPSAPPEPPPSSGGEGSRRPTLKERLAAYKAKKLAAINQAVADATPPPLVAKAPDLAPAPPPPPEPPPEAAPPTMMVAPAFCPAPSAPQAAPQPAPPAPSRGPGERIIRLTYNTAAFAALVVIGLVFCAYALGVQAGRGRAGDAESTPPTAAPVAPVKHYSILLAQWPTRSARDRLRANDAAYQLTRAIRRAGLGKPRAETVQRRSQAHLALYMGDYTNPLSQENRALLSKIRDLKLGNTRPFAKSAFEERPRK